MLTVISRWWRQYWPMPRFAHRQPWTPHRRFVTAPAPHVYLARTIAQLAHGLLQAFQQTVEGAGGTADFILAVRLGAQAEILLAADLLDGVFNMAQPVADIAYSKVASTLVSTTASTIRVMATVSTRLKVRSLSQPAGRPAGN
jgi:hypothetical protein